MKALAGRIPRCLKSHRTPEGAAYGDYLRAKQERLGPLPSDARPLLREAGLLTLDLMRLRADQQVALARGRRGEAQAIGDRLVTLRGQFLTIEARLEELGSRKPPSIADLVAQRRASG